MLSNLVLRAWAQSRSGPWVSWQCHVIWLAGLCSASEIRHAISSATGPLLANFWICKGRRAGQMTWLCRLGLTPGPEVEHHCFTTLRKLILFFWHCWLLNKPGFSHQYVSLKKLDGLQQVPTELHKYEFTSQENNSHYAALVSQRGSQQKKLALAMRFSLSMSLSTCKEILLRWYQTFLAISSSRRFSSICRWSCWYFRKRLLAASRSCNSFTFNSLFTAANLETKLKRNK